MHNKKATLSQTAKTVPHESQLPHLGMRQVAFHYHSQVQVRGEITSSSCILLGTGQKD